MVQPRGSPTRSISSSVAELLSAEQTQLQCVESVLKLLHITEFYVLIDFAEVAVAGIFALCVLALSCMPNRVYYFQLKGQSDAQLQTMVQQLTLYAALEILSFVGLCGVINHQLHHFSTIQQLAFVLRKHWTIVMPTMTFWVFMNVLLTLEHLGMDFTFQFKWMHSAPSPL